MTPTDLLRNLSERGHPRGSDAVFRQAQADADNVVVLPIGPPERSSTRRFVLVAATVLILMVGGYAAWPRETFTPLETTTDPPSRASAPNPDRSPFAHAPDELPRLIIDQPGFAVEHVSQHVYANPPAPLAPSSVYQDAAHGMGGVTLITGVMKADETDIAGSAIEVNGIPATVQSVGIVHVVSWLDGPDRVLIIGIGVSADELQVIAEGAVPTDTGVYELTKLDDAIVLVGSGEGVGGEFILSGENEYILGDIRGDILMSSGSVFDAAQVLLDRSFEASEMQPLLIGKISGVMLNTDGTNQLTAIWWSDDIVFELRGSYPDMAALASAANSLRSVDGETWIEYVPKDTVMIDELSATIESMLADMAAPAGFDVERVIADAQPNNRYQLGAYVSGAVACAWIETWIEANVADDFENRNAAVDGLATSRQWSILIEMAPEGGFPDVVWQFADAIAGEGAVTMGSVLTVDDTYRDALGCER